MRSFTLRPAKVPVQAPARQRMRYHTFPAPVGGWVLHESLVQPNSGGAAVMENFFPQTQSVRPRAGSYRQATVGTGKVQSLITYHSGSTNKLFAAHGGSIFDVTNPVDRMVAPTPVVTGQTANYYSHVQFSTAGGDYLLAVNGADFHQVFDGTAWAQNTPAITGVSSELFSHIWSHKSRLWFVYKNSKTAYYLPIDSVGGSVTAFSLDGIFRRGGKLLFGATWSLDAGDGMDDKCLFFSDLGEVAVYEGSNPASASDWSLIGRYDTAAPLGANATMQAGGDLMVATVDGFVPISAAINKDRAAITLSAISRPIEPVWKADALSRTSQPWEIAKWPELNMAIVSVPADAASQDPYCYVVNMLTGKWAKYTGWDVQCLAHHEGFVYFGTSDGKVMQAEVGGNDDGLPYICKMAGLFEMLGSPAIKIVHQARATWTYSQPLIDKVSLSTNYQTRFPAPPQSISDSETSAWDVSRWDIGRWNSNEEKIVRSRWVSIGKTGFTISPQIQVTFGVTTAPSSELVSIDITYEVGGVVV